MKARYIDDYNSNNMKTRTRGQEIRIVRGKIIFKSRGRQEVKTGLRQSGQENKGQDCLRSDLLPAYGMEGFLDDPLM